MEGFLDDLSAAPYMLAYRLKGREDWCFGTPFRGDEMFTNLDAARRRLAAVRRRVGAGRYDFKAVLISVTTVEE